MQCEAAQGSPLGPASLCRGIAGVQTHSSKRWLCALRASDLPIVLCHQRLHGKHVIQHTGVLRVECSAHSRPEAPARGLAGRHAAGTLEEQHAAADQAKADREKMLKKLKMYESKIIQSEKEGGKSLVEIAQEKELRLQEQREELEKRCAPAPQVLNTWWSLVAASSAVKHATADSTQA